MIKLLILSILLFGALVSAVPSCTPSITKVSGSGALKTENICSGELIFNDEFDTLDEGKWNHEINSDGYGNGEFEAYVNDRSVDFAESSHLTILPKVVGTDEVNSNKNAPKSVNPVQSARLNTQGKFSFTYGRVEVRARNPVGDWLWPAAWLLPEDSAYGDWPVSGEIDIMESRGNRDLVQGGRNIGNQLMGSTMHWGVDRASNRNAMTHWEQANGAGYNSDFHSYQVEWTPDHIMFSVDGAQIGSIYPPDGGFYQYGGFTGNNPWASGSKMAPFDKNFFVILNLAIGANNGYFPDDASNASGKPWKNGDGNAAQEFWDGRDQWWGNWDMDTEDRAFFVDYVRVYAL